MPGSKLSRCMVAAFFALNVMLYPYAQAQEVPDTRPMRPGTPPPLPQLEERPSEAPPGQILPPIAPPLPSTPGKKKPLVLPRIFVRKILVTGSTVFSSDKLDEVTAPYENRAVTAEDLEELRLALTRLYIEHGYVTSGAILPDQKVTDGVITMHIIEGTLDRIEVEGNKWFRSGYVRRRLALGAQPPVKITALQQRLRLLQQDDRIERLDAELRPGIQRGESELYVRVREPLPFFVEAGFNNYQAPSVGAERGFITVAHRNLTGHGDILSSNFSKSTGTDLQVASGYTLPLTARDTTLNLRYSRNATIVVEEPFASLDIETKSNTFGITLRHPLYRDLQREFALAFTGEHERSETFLEGERFAFAPGSDNGETYITVLRFALEWTDRTQNRVIAARSRFSLGIDALGATINDNSELPDGRFQAWLGQFQWVQRFSLLDIQTLFRFDVQLAAESLFALEQISVGGRYSVRGYRENQLVRDSGVIVSLETRVPLVVNKPWADFLQLAPFVDFGRAWNVDLPTLSPKMIASIGVGLRWAATILSSIRLRPQFEIYWGYRLKHVDNPHDNLQDLGLYLQFVLSAL